MQTEYFIVPPFHKEGPRSGTMKLFMGYFYSTRRRRQKNCPRRMGINCHTAFILQSHNGHLGCIMATLCRAQTGCAMPARTARSIRRKMFIPVKIKTKVPLQLAEGCLYSAFRLQSVFKKSLLCIRTAPQPVLARKCMEQRLMHCLGMKDSGNYDGLYDT